MYTEMDCRPATALREYLQKQDRDRREEKVADDDSSASILDHIEEFIRFAMVIRFNSVELCPPEEDGSGPGTDYGHGLFERACKMSHSCKPNCVWLTTQDGKAKEIRAIMTIEKGDELTIDYYVGNALEPIPQRRQELLMTKGFICECDRCAAKGGDDTRRFLCINHDSTTCSGVHFLEQPLLSSAPQLLNCNRCGVTATQSYTTWAVQRELELVKEIKELDQATGSSEVSDRIAQLEPPHHLHSLAEKCYEMQGELYSTTGEYRAAAEAYAKQIECRVAIFGSDYPNQTTAFCCERMGDALRHVNVEEAEEAYKRTVRVLQMMRGGLEDPYSKCALTKLLDLQSRLPDMKLPHQSGVEGIADPPNGPHEAEYPCQCCGNSSKKNSSELNYCCEEHRRMHLSRVVEQTLQAVAEGSGADQ
jgi:hypothetical protein